MTAPLVQLCMPADFNAATQTCAAPFFGPVPSAFPVLSIADAQTIGLSIALLWGVAYAIRMVRRALQQIG